MLSKHFTESEFRCSHCGAEKVSFLLIAGLESLRTLVDEPIYVNSGYRCPKHPLAIRNPGSQHCQGTAADIRVAKMSLLSFYKIANIVQEFQDGGIGIYPDWNQPGLHVDVRGYRARWGRLGDVYVDINEVLKRLEELG